MSKEKSIGIWVFAAILFVVCLYGVYTVGKHGGIAFEQRYQVVVLDDGQTFFGKLSLYPEAKIIDAWYPQTQTEGEKKTTLFPAMGLYYGLDRVIHLDRNHISWWANLSTNSDVVKLINQNMTSSTDNTGY